MRELVTEPGAATKRALDVEAVVSAGIEDEQGVLEQKVADLLGVDESFLETQKEGFEGSDEGMTVRADASRLSSLPLFNDGSIEEGKRHSILEPRD